ncbi:probable prolyl 4-hydroxylase 3 [Miscanthus floridulus]|uniref:probable prolyl 4-hydroxylase 3 n=1 Tax=Miscanthus floridulus TaxID=154761 RepID=UPI003459C53A
MEELSTEPRATVYHNFLSKKECDHLISLAKPHMTRSKVVDSLTGERKESSSRTSSGMSLTRGQDTIIRTIEKRIADYTSIPIENGEGLQVLHYAIGQKFEPHFDYTDVSLVTKNGGPCMATLLMYLSDVEKGGETVFPNATAKGKLSHQCLKLKSGISVKPKMGDALLFWSMKPDGSRDPTSLHGASPVIKGDKWSATKWMHVNKYN